MSRPVIERSARFSSASTVLPFACCCQPAKFVPSYSSTTLIFTCQASSSVDEFDDHHRGRVTEPRAFVNDPCVTARPLGQARDQVREQPLHHLWLRDLLRDPS